MLFVFRFFSLFTCYTIWDFFFCILIHVVRHVRGEDVMFRGAISCLHFFIMLLFSVMGVVQGEVLEIGRYDRHHLVV